MKRRQGNNDSAKPGHSQTPSILVPKEQKPEEDKLDVLNQVVVEEEKQQKKRKLERRRSSIDQKFDPKFGADVSEKAKDIEERKKKLIDSIQSKGEKKVQDDRIVGQNLLDLKFAKVKSQG